MSIKDEDVLLFYSLGCLILGGVFILIGNIFVPHYEMGYAVTPLPYYSFFPFGFLFILGGGLLLGGLLSPVFLLLVKLYKKLRK